MRHSIRSVEFAVRHEWLKSEYWAEALQTRRRWMRCWMGGAGRLIGWSGLTLKWVPVLKHNGWEPKFLEIFQICQVT